MPPPDEPIPSSPRNDKRPDPTVAEESAIHGVRGVARGHAATALGILRERSAEVRTLSAVAQEVHLSRSQLVRAFDTMVGISPRFRSNQLDGLSSLASIPLTNLLVILAGMPLAAVLIGWLAAGREPAGMSRQPLE